MNGDIYVKVTIEKKGKFQNLLFFISFKILFNRSMQHHELMAAQFSFLMIMALLSVYVMMCHNK